MTTFNHRNMIPPLFVDLNEILNKQVFWKKVIASQNLPNGPKASLSAPYLSYTKGEAPDLTTHIIVFSSCKKMSKLLE